MWSNWFGKNRKTDEKHDEICFGQRFQLTKVKLEGGKEAPGIANCSINI